MALNETESSFYKEIYEMVKRHPATNNSFINRFSKGDVSYEEFINFSVEFYHFTREWVSILSILLANTINEVDAESLTRILVSELGDNDPKKRHELLYRKYLRSIGINPEDLIFRKQLPTTKQWLDKMREYFSTDHFTALGAEYGLENMAIPMWDKLIPGLQKAREKFENLKNMDIEYFTFHRQLEEHHEEEMANVLGVHINDPVAREKFLEGARGMLDSETIFWEGLSLRDK
ncbi:MAG: iron-containing redox enzyme family protein [Thermoplasmatales archaeon]